MAPRISLSLLRLTRVWGWVRILIPSESLLSTAQFIVPGFAILQNGVIVSSADNSGGVDAVQPSTTTYGVTAFGADGSAVDNSATTLSFQEMSGPYMNEVDEDKTMITSDLLLSSLQKVVFGLATV